MKKILLVYLRSKDHYSEWNPFLFNQLAGTICAKADQNIIVKITCFKEMIKTILFTHIQNIKGTTKKKRN